MSRCRFRMMRSWVSVPVLSVHNTSMAPKFWIACSRLTITRLRDMAIAPLARLAVTIIGNISGVRPTATASANRSASSQSPLGEAIDQEHQRNQHQDEADHQPGEAVDPFLEARPHALLGDGIGKLTKIGVATGMNDLKSPCFCLRSQAETWHVLHVLTLCARRAARK